MNGSRFSKATLILLASFGAFCPLGADEAVSGKLTVDQNASATALEIKGGASGNNLAVFRRDIGADAEIRINAPGSNPQIVFDDLVGTSDDGLWAIGLSAADNSFRIVNNGSIYGATNEFFTIKNGGKVGIGTTSPSGLLHVVGGLNQNDLVVGESATAPYFSVQRFSGGTIATTLGGSNFGTLIQGREASHTAIAIPANDGSDSFTIVGPSNFASPFTYDAALLTVKASGKVGIGTNTPANQLDVNGTIRAKEVIVETNWADYVFDPAYELKSLEEVGRHIQEHRRLPGMPSADDVSQSGVPLGDSQRLLLEKIEELTLYAISQERRLNDKDALIEELVARIERLEADD